MKKKILFVLTYLDCGGICRALQNFLMQYNTVEYDVDVFSMVHTGMYCGKMPNCTILPKDFRLDALLARYAQRSGIDKAVSLLFKIVNKASRGKMQKFLFKKRGEKLMQNKYDAVVAFSEGIPTYFVSMMNHPNKIAWIHCDYASYRSIYPKDEEKIYMAFQHIVCVSDFTRSSFLHYYPVLSDKSTFIYNIVDVEMMKSMAQENPDVPFDEDSFHIVSVGRLDPVKHLSIAPVIAQKVKMAGYKIQWFIIGPKGPVKEYDSLQKNIDSCQAREYVKVLGEKSNPYAYISKADLLVNTSLSEACPYVINEAKVLGTPVICPDFGSATEFIEDGVNGIISPIGYMAERIIDLIGDEQKYNGIKHHLSSFTYDNDAILSQIYALIEQ